jgi:hypothetical protein
MLAWVSGVFTTSHGSSLSTDITLSTSTFCGVVVGTSLLCALRVVGDVVVVIVTVGVVVAELD